jgi:dTDP-4-dehydrorhamnose 3,5-epimerase-like enzyme
MHILFRQRLMSITRGGHIRGLHSSSSEHNLTTSINTEPFWIVHEFIVEG